MALPDNIYYWIKYFFDEHYHCTNYAGVLSTEAAVTSSVIQCSGLGPASYLVPAADLHPVHSGNYMFKFAEDTYLVIPASNMTWCEAEIKHIQQCADVNT